MDATNDLDAIVCALREAGYDPYAQLCGYLKTGDETFITRRHGAREKVKRIMRDDIIRYAERLAPPKSK